jgi:uncharacterized RDD family membrane protein YckC
MRVDETLPDAVSAWKATPAGVGLRTVATILDWFILVFASMFLFILVEAVMPPEIVVGLTCIMALLYYILFEGKFGATPGKMLVGLKVVQSDGGPCDYQAATMRTALRIIDFLPVTYLVAVVSVWLSPRKQRIGDRLAGTMVVKGLWLKLKVGGS